VAGWGYAGSVMRSCGSLASFALLASALAGCREPQREGPAALAEQRATLLAQSASVPAPPAPCEPVSARADVPELSLVPSSLAGFCVDRNVELRAVEKQPQRPGFPRALTSELDEACQSRLGPLCASYLEDGLERLVAFRYSGGAGQAGSLDVLMTRFAASEGSFASFSDQVLGDSDPSRLKVDTLEPAGTAVRLGNVALGWRGPWLVRLGYSNSAEPSAERARSADTLFRGVLEHVARALRERDPGSLALPRAVQALPAAGLVPFAVSYQTGPVLGVAGARGAAQGYYRDGKRRWRTLVIVRPDPESAEDVMDAFERHRDGYALKYDRLPALRFNERRPAGEANRDWVIGRKGSIVYGIGDDPAPAEIAAAEEIDVKLTLWQKLEMLTEVASRPLEAAPEPGPEARGGTP
jgi:uncharacterized protein DUF6599